MPWYFTLAESRTKHKNVQQKRKWNRSVKRQIIFLYHVVLGKANWQLKRRLYSKFEASSFTSPWQVKVHASMFHLVLKPFEHNVNEPEVIDQSSSISWWFVSGNIGCQMDYQRKAWKAVTPATHTDSHSHHNHIHKQHFTQLSKNSCSLACCQPTIKTTWLEIMYSHEPDHWASELNLVYITSVTVLMK